MPLPTPNSGESESDFIGRCMGNETAIDDFPDQEQRLAVCFSQFRRERAMDNGTERKAFVDVEVKDAAKGLVTARFATLGVIDHDGDITEHGAFGKQQVRVSSFGHTSWHGELPVGRGDIYEEDDSAIAELQFFMDTQTGREHFEVIKGLGDLGEWSYGFKVKEQAAPDEEQRQAGVWRILKKLIVHEVSPVLKGAGIGTGTLAVKTVKREAKHAYKLRCMNCGYFIGEATQPLVFVANLANAVDVDEKQAPPRDVRLCKGCGTFNVYVPKDALTVSTK